MNIYVSTSAIKSPFDLENVLRNYDEIGLKYIELGSSHKYCANIETVINKFKHMNFIIHNYFPPVKEPFALNISSIDENIRRASINHAKQAIDLCWDIKSQIYSMHAGMVANPDKIEFFEGFSFDEINVTKEVYELSFNKLIESCLEINDYAKSKSIKFAIETSGGHPSKYKYLMMTREHEFERLLKEVNDHNFGILFDIGHFNVSTAVYSEERIESFIKRFKNKIFQVHVHHNDGSNDQHLPPTRREIELLSFFSRDTIIVLESMNNNREDILMSLDSMKKYLNNIV